MSDLAEAITDSIDTQTERASELGRANRIKDCAAIIDEWTTHDGHECILTKYLTDELEKVSEFMIYASIEDDQLVAGSFSFDPEAELPIDNN